jgi:hypothetical protein
MQRIQFSKLPQEQLIQQVAAAIAGSASGFIAYKRGSRSALFTQLAARRNATQKERSKEESCFSQSKMLHRQ